MSEVDLTNQIKGFGEKLLTVFVEREGVLTKEELEMLSKLKEVCENLEKMTDAFSEFEHIKDLLNKKGS